MFASDFFLSKTHLIPTPDMSPLYVIASCSGKLFIVTLGFVAVASFYFKDQRHAREHRERLAAYKQRENTKEGEESIGWPTKPSIEAQAGALH